MNDQQDNSKKSTIRWPHLMIWQAAQLLLLCLFLYSLFYLEMAVLSKVRGGTVDGSVLEIHFDLAQRQWSFLPASFWSLFWPLLCVTGALLLFTRARWYFLGAAGLLTQLLLIADRIYHDFFSTITSMASFRAAGQVWAVRESVFASLRLSDLAFFVWFAGLCVFGYWANKRVSFRLRQQPTMFLADKIQAGIFLVLALHAGLVAYAVPTSEANSVQSGFGDADAGFVKSYHSSSLNYALHFGLLNFHLHDFWQGLNAGFTSRTPEPEQVELVRQMITRRQEYNLKTSPYFGLGRGRNVVLISMEAFQHYLLDLRVDGQEITPVLNRLAAVSFSWDYIVDNMSVGGTSDAEFAVLTGLMPDTRQISSLTIPAKNRLVALPATLRELGYATASLHGYTPSFWKRESNHPRLGIERMYFQNSFDYKRIGLGVPDHTFFNQSVAMLQEMPRPFFAFLISLSSHHPYTMVPPGEPRLNLNMDRSMARDYLHSIHYTDRALGSFLDGMATAGLLENSMFVIYGDHSAPMTEQSSQLMRQATGIDPASLRQKRIPLLFYLPGAILPSGEERTTISVTAGGLQDVFPTVCHLLGLEPPPGMYGVHLFVPNDARPAAPCFKKANSFVYRGVLYDPLRGQPVRDEQGPLFYVDGVQPDVAVLREVYQQVGNDILAHRTIFDYDAQWHALQDK